MSPATIEVAAPSRLHFGMFSFGRPRERQFGGVGAMIAAPGLELRASAAPSFSATGPLADRVCEFARRVGAAWGLDGPPAARIEVRAAPPAHMGLGVGTQLGLAVATALAALAERPLDDSARLAESARRGERSAVGSHGFRLGGLIVEAGKRPGDRLAPLIARQALPDHWRFVLAQPRGEEGLSGEAERRAFAALRPAPAPVTAELCRLALLELTPAAMSADFETFSRALYEYGRLAGSCFAESGGSPFASAGLARLVARIRGLGAEGVAQSSWGPTLFVVQESQQAAEEFAARFRRVEGEATVDLLISPPANQGARVTRIA